MASTREIVFSVLLFGAMLSSCVPDSVRDAQHVVAQADSLWREGKMYGVDDGDSATLAQAYHTLSSSIILPSLKGGEGGRLLSCYHYGRLLRAKDNPVEAMQVFIDATHSRTRDYHILGRVYSNMGDICHLAGDFPLSYDMFERSADMFLQNGDTLNYYYALNDMAFELAEQGRKEETLKLVDSISSMCSDKEISPFITLTIAALYNNLYLYDSVLVITRTASLGDHQHTASEYALKANALWKTNNKDSALTYAKFVMNLPNASKQDKYNMMFIIINGDSTLTNDEVIRLSGERSDIEFEILNPLHHKLTIAVELLKQDLNRKTDFQWLYAIIITITIIGLIIGLYVRRKHRQHRLLSQQVDDLQNMNDAEIQRQEQIRHEHAEYTTSLALRVEKYCTILSQAKDFPNNISWKDFDAMSKLINDNLGMLVIKLQSIYHLSEKEIRLCILVLIEDPSGTRLADLLCYAKSGIRNFKNRTASKLGTNSVELRNFLINLAINSSLK